MAAFAFPGVEAYMVVIAAGRNERRTGAHALHHLKPEYAAVKPERAIEIGDLEMDMPDPRTGNDGWILGHVVSPFRRFRAPDAAQRFFSRALLSRGPCYAPVWIPALR